jgi:trimeric autotransporter adhesin
MGTITTIAGNGVSGFSGDGGLATAAAIGMIYGIAFDGSGNLYMSDINNYRIRMIANSTGIITTVAGTGVSGYTGDGGLATAADLLNPSGIAVDVLSGDLYIASNPIRMVTKSTGIISTVASSDPSNMAYDATGLAVDPKLQLLYILSNERLLMQARSTGEMTVIAGQSTGGYSGDGGLATNAYLQNPFSITVDVSTGNIYIADNGNYRVRMITKSTGIITTVAGTGEFGYTGDGGLATAATLGSTMGISVDMQGNFYFADSSKNCVRKVTKSTGIITTVAGTGVSGFSGDGGPAVAAQLNSPWGVAVNPAAGIVALYDLGNVRIRSFTVPKGASSPSTAPTGRTVLCHV